MTPMKNCVWVFPLALLLCGCASRSEKETKSLPASITNLNPATAIVGKPFYVNSKAGLSTLGVSGANLAQNSTVRVGSQVLTTDVRRDGTFAAALVPARGGVPPAVLAWQLGSVVFVSATVWYLV